MNYSAFGRKSRSTLYRRRASPLNRKSFCFVGWACAPLQKLKADGGSKSSKKLDDSSLQFIKRQ